MGGRARRNLEEDLGEAIISKENFLGLSNETKKQKELPFDEEIP